MLNEGWDVLNLFDIVRLYETRDGKWTRDDRYIPGTTTLSEVQLIGRGARYYPFKLNEEQDKFKRKFDQELKNEMKIVEELYYHSSYIPRYITEITSVLRESGIMPPQETKTIHLKVKENIKEIDFWKEGFIFINTRDKTDRSGIKDINDIDVSKTYGPIRLRTGFTQERIIFEEEKKQEEEKIMERKTLGIVLIILGLIVLAFPLLGLIPIAILTGLGVAFMGIGLILAGFSDREVSSGLGLLEIVLGIIALVLGLGFILNPSLFSFVAGLLVALAGLFLIIIGIVGVFTKTGGSRWNGVVAIIIGLIYLIFGYIIKDPFWLGVLIGLWLLLTGIIMFFQKD